MLQLLLQRWREAAHVRAHGAQDGMARRLRSLGHVCSDPYLDASMLEREHLVRQASGAACFHGCQQRLARQRTHI